MWFGISSTVIFDSFCYSSCWFSNIVKWTVFCRTLYLIYYIVLMFKFVSLCHFFCFKITTNCFRVKAVCSLTFSGRILLAFIFIELMICIPFFTWYGGTIKWFLMLVFSSSFTWISFSYGVISLISLKKFVITECR